MASIAYPKLCLPCAVSGEIDGEMLSILHFQSHLASNFVIRRNKCRFNRQAVQVANLTPNPTALSAIAKDAATRTADGKLLLATMNSCDIARQNGKRVKVLQLLDKYYLQM